MLNPAALQFRHNRSEAFAAGYETAMSTQRVAEKEIVYADRKLHLIFSMED